MCPLPSVLEWGHWAGWEVVHPEKGRRALMRASLQGGGCWGCVCVCTCMNPLFTAAWRQALCQMLYRDEL